MTMVTFWTIFRIICVKASRVINLMIQRQYFLLHMTYVFIFQQIRMSTNDAEVIVGFTSDPKI